MHLIASILIKDTTREQREQIVRESLGDDFDVGCGYEKNQNLEETALFSFKNLEETALFA